jgi:hypothetical protein
MDKRIREHVNVPQLSHTLLLACNNISYRTINNIMGPMLWQVRAAAGGGHTPGDDSDSDKRKSIIDHFMGSMLW